MAMHDAIIITDKGAFYYGNVGNPPLIDGCLLSELPDDWEPDEEHRNHFPHNLHLVDRRTQKGITDENMQKMIELEAQANNGRGVSCVRGIIATIKQGDIKGALAWYRLDSDKLRQYPELRAHMRITLGDPYSDEFDEALEKLQEE